MGLPLWCGSVSVGAQAALLSGCQGVSVCVCVCLPFSSDSGACCYLPADRSQSSIRVKAAVKRVAPTWSRRQIVRFLSMVTSLVVALGFCVVLE